jgi:hypothetical protein
MRRTTTTTSVTLLPIPRTRVPSGRSTSRIYISHGQHVETPPEVLDEFSSLVKTRNQKIIREYFMRQMCLHTLLPTAAAVCQPGAENDAVLSWPTQMLCASHQSVYPPDKRPWESMRLEAQQERKGLVPDRSAA